LDVENKRREIEIRKCFMRSVVGISLRDKNRSGGTKKWLGVNWTNQNTTVRKKKLQQVLVGQNGPMGSCYEDDDDRYNTFF
jgi:hypothetical protein